MNTAFEVFTAEKVNLYLSEQFSEFPGLKTDFNVWRHPELHSMIAQIRAWLIGGKVPGNTQTETVKWPDGVWQMFKEKYLPYWFKKRFPVRWHEEKFEVVTNHYFVCPHLVTDPQGMHIKFMATGTPLASMMSGYPRE